MSGVNMLALALAIAGYVLLMLTNPVRASLRDGWRCVRRLSWAAARWRLRRATAAQALRCLWLGTWCSMPRRAAAWTSTATCDSWTPAYGSG